MEIVAKKEITEELILKALQLDYSVFPKKYWLQLEQCKKYYKKNPNIYYMMINNNDVIGYLNFSPITKEAYDKIKLGKETDVFLSDKDIVEYEDNKLYFGYLSSVVVKENYRRQGIAKQLLSCLAQDLMEYTKRGIFFKEIVADVLNENGAKLAEIFGLHKLYNSANNSEIFGCSLIPFDINKTEMNKIFYERYKGK